MISLARLPLCLAALALAGCNAIFGITSGEPTGGTGGGGSDACRPPRAEPCDPSAQTADDCCVTGRSCQGGTCDQGECTPVTLAASQSTEAVQVLVAGDEVVWSTGSNKKIFAAPIASQNGNQRLVGSAEANGFKNVYGIASDGTYVYFTDFELADIGRMPLAGGSAELVVQGKPTDVYSNPGGVPKIAVGGGYLYWAAPPTGVYRAKLGGSLPLTEELVGTSENSFAVATDETHVYYADFGAQTINRVPHGAALPATPETIVTGWSYVYSLSVDDTSVCWTDYDSVHCARKDAQDKDLVTPMKETDSSTNDVYADGHDVYWTTVAFDPAQLGGRVRRAPKKGGTVHTFAQNSSMFGMGGITGTCDTLVWIDGSTVSVIKATK
jgi:hypothetical protein